MDDNERTVLAQTREWFLKDMARRRCEPNFEDRALTIEGAAWLFDHIVLMKPKRVIELGSGFSTFVLGRACYQVGAELLTADHDATWIADVMDMMRSGAAPCPVTKMPTAWNIDQARKSRGEFGHAGLVFVDHGPTMDQRIADVPWIVGLLVRHGYVAFDDFRDHTRFERHVRSVVRNMKLPISLVRIAGDGHDRWLGVGRKWRA